MKKALVGLAVGLLLVGGLTATVVAWKQGRLPWKPNAVPAGPVQAATASFEFAVYFLAAPREDVSTVLDGLLAREFKAFSRVAASPDGKNELQVSARLRKDVQESYRPPDSASIDLFGRGLSPEQAEALQHSKEAFVLDFALPREKVWEGGRLACRLVAALATRSGGLVWDEETREVFTPEAWESGRIVPWTAAIPDVSRHTVIHSYQDGEFVRAISLGLGKFGLPDLVIENFPWSLNRNVGHLINLTAQAMAEGAEVNRGGTLRLRLADIRDREVREPQIASLKAKGTGEAVLALRNATPQDGDPRNRLIEIAFDTSSGSDVHDRQQSLLSEFFGTEDSVTPARHDAELLAASQRARARLPAVRSAFLAGLKPGEYVMVKAPFRTFDDGQEWMWVEVTSWRTRAIRGVLQNRPDKVPALRAGQVVDVREDEVFDYVVHHPDGKEEGNETSAIIEAQQLAGKPQ